MRDQSHKTDHITHPEVGSSELEEVDDDLLFENLHDLDVPPAEAK